MKTIVAISDTHGYHHDLYIPDGDFFIHAGDFTRDGTLEDIEEFNYFLGRLPHRHKIVIAGNHDWCCELQPEFSRSLLTNAIYLQDEAITIEGIKFYGSPWQPWFCDWAFNLKRGPELAQKWALIPNDTDILITHGPPAGICDKTITGEHVGCEDLLRRIQQVRPKYHIFGHIHEAAGTEHHRDTTFFNACVCKFFGSPTDEAFVIPWQSR